MGLWKPQKAIEDPPTIVNFDQMDATTIICDFKWWKMMKTSQCG